MSTDTSPGLTSIEELHARLCRDATAYVRLMLETCRLPPLEPPQAREVAHRLEQRISEIVGATLLTAPETPIAEVALRARAAGVAIVCETLRLDLGPYLVSGPQN